MGAYEMGSCPVAEPLFLRGDSNDDGNVDISDPIFILNGLFNGGPTPGCLAAADTNADIAVNISDPVYLLNYLFASGPAPVEPFPNCGLPPEGEKTNCEIRQENCPQ